MPTQSLTDQLRQLEKEITKHDEAATKGPWERWLNYSGDHELMDCRIAAPENRHLAQLENLRGSVQTIADSDFIAFARTALLDLLAVAKGLEEERDQLEELYADSGKDLEAVTEDAATLRAENERLDEELTLANTALHAAEMEATILRAEINGLETSHIQCPWPRDVWPMTSVEYCEAIPDEKLRTSISGFLMREGWEVAFNQIKELTTP